MVPSGQPLCTQLVWCVWSGRWGSGVYEGSRAWTIFLGGTQEVLGSSPALEAPVHCLGLKPLLPALGPSSRTLRVSWWLGTCCSSCGWALGPQPWGWLSLPCTAATGGGSGCRSRSHTAPVSLGPSFSVLLFHPKPRSPRTGEGRW